MVEIVRCVKVSKFIGGRNVLNNITLIVRRGERINIYGPKDSGKTMLLKCILDLVVRDGGYVEVLGQDPLNSRDEVLKNIGYIPQSTNIPTSLDPGLLIDIINELYGRDGRLMEELGLYEISRLNIDQNILMTRIYTYQILVKKPKLVLIDDIYTKNDGKSIYLIKRYIDRNGATLITTSREISRIFGENRFYYMEGGRIFESPG